MARFVYDAETGLMVPGRRIERVRCMPLCMGAPQQALASYGAVAGPAVLPFANRVIGLHMEGTNGGTTFTDNSPTPKTVTAAGGAVTSTAQAWAGSSSLSLGGTFSDHIDVAGNAAFSLTDFCVRFRFRAAAEPSQRIMLDINSNAIFDIRYAQSGANNVTVFYSTSYLDFTIPLTWANNTWFLVEVSRASGVMYGFIDGVLGATVSNANTGFAFQATPPLRIGAPLAGAGTPSAMFIDEVEIYNVAGNTASYTPPTAAFADS